MGKVKKPNRNNKKKSKLLTAVEIDMRIRKYEAEAIGNQVKRGNPSAERLLSTYVLWQKNGRDEQTGMQLSLAYRKYKKALQEGLVNG